MLNLTPHSIDIYDVDKTTVLISLPSVGEWRLAEAPTVESAVMVGDKVVRTVDRAAYTGLVDKAGKPVVLENYVGQAVVVSSLVGTYLVDHQVEVVVYVPSTGPANSVRTQQGQIIGTTALEAYARGKTRWSLPK